MNRTVSFDELRSKMHDSKSSIGGGLRLPIDPSILEGITQPPGLQRFLFHLSQMVSAELMEDASVSWEYFMTTDLYRVAIVGRLWGEELQSEEFSTPVDWWQSFKLRWFPEWLLSRYPIKWHTVRLEIRALYPELYKKLRLPDEPHAIIIERSDWIETFDEEE